MSSRRLNAPLPGSIPTHSRTKETARAEKYLPFLSEVTEGCTIAEIDPSACVPLFLVRGLCENAVRKLVAILNGDHVERAGEMQLVGMVSGAPSSIVVPLVGKLEIYVDEYLSTQYASSEDVSVVKASHRTWFGVIDGCHLLIALHRLREAYPIKWKTFIWKVISVRSGQDISEYHKLARVQNERNKQIYHFEMTLYDLLKGLRDTYDKLYGEAVKKSRVGLRGVNVLHKEVAKAYDGAEHDKTLP